MSTSQHLPQSTTAQDSLRNSIELVVRQQPVKARLCSFKEKVDRRPVDPPPIIQLICHEPNNDQNYLHNPYYFLYATLVSTDDEDLEFINGTRTTAGSVVQSLHKLKDVDDKDGGFFIFADISVRHEGHFKLKFTLFRIVEYCFFITNTRCCYRNNVYRLCSVFSNTFQVYSPKTFPGMSESTFLTRCFSDQGVRIRIRKETRVPASNVKRRRTENEDEPPPTSSHQEERSRSLSQPDTINNAMSMQNLLRSDSTTPSGYQQTPPPSSPVGNDSNYQYRYEPTLYRPSLQLPPIQQQRPLPHDLFMDRNRATAHSPVAADQNLYYQDGWSQQQSGRRQS